MAGMDTTTFNEIKDTEDDPDVDFDEPTNLEMVATLTSHHNNKNNNITNKSISNSDSTSISSSTSSHSRSRSNSNNNSNNNNNNNPTCQNNNYMDEDVDDDDDIINIDDTPIMIIEAPKSMCEIFKMLLGAGIGNFLEWFDFAIFGLLANELSQAFFPNNDNNNNILSLLEIFSVYGSAFLIRPIGGILFGYIGDKYGRITALRISIFMMAIPTFLTGILPTYNDIGIISTIFLVILRLLQGLSIGGEFAGALVYIIEVAPINKRIMFGAFVQITGTGVLGASILDAVLRSIFNDDDMYKFGWRIPFLFGLIVAMFGCWMRKGLIESKDFEMIKKKTSNLKLNNNNNNNINQNETTNRNGNRNNDSNNNNNNHSITNSNNNIINNNENDESVDNNSGKIQKNPIKTALLNIKLNILVVILHNALPGISYYTLFVWLPTYLRNSNLRKNEDYVIDNPYIINTYAIICSFIFMLISGIICDKYANLNKMMISFGWMFLLSCLIFFPIIDNLDKHYINSISIIICIIASVYGMYHAGTGVWAVLTLPNVETRFSGMGIGFNVSMALFSGTTPFIATLVTSQSGIFSYALIIFSYGVVSLTTDTIVAYLQYKGQWNKPQMMRQLIKRNDNNNINNNINNDNYNNKYQINDTNKIRMSPRRDQIPLGSVR